MENKTIFGVILALFGFGVFATHDAVIKSLGGEIAVPQIMFFAQLFAFPVMALLVMSDRRNENFRPHNIKLIGLRTFTGLMTGLCGFYAFTVLPLADVYGLIFTMPLLITLLAVPFLGEKLGIWRVGAVILGFVGVLVMLPRGGAALSLGHFAAMAAAFFGATNAIITRRIGSTERREVIIMIQMIVTLVVMGTWSHFVYEPIAQEDLYRLMVIGVFAAIAQLSIILAYQRCLAAVIAPMQYSQLLWAIFYGYIFFEEAISTQKLLGATIIVASGLIILFRESTSGRSQAKPVLSVSNFRPDAGRALRRRSIEGMPDTQEKDVL